MCIFTFLKILFLIKIPFQENDQEKIVQPGIFRRKIIGPVIHISNPSKPSDDSVPPSKIGDLKIRQVPGRGKYIYQKVETIPQQPFKIGNFSLKLLSHTITTPLIATLFY